MESLQCAHVFRVFVWLTSDSPTRNHSLAGVYKPWLAFAGMQETQRLCRRRPVYCCVCLNLRKEILKNSFFEVQPARTSRKQAVMCIHPRG